MSRQILTDTATGAAAIAHSYTVRDNDEIIRVTCKFSIAPTSSENYTITLDSLAGAAYDVVLYSVDPSVASATSIVWSPDKRERFVAGDIITVAYTNTDTRTYGSVVYLDTNPAM